MTSTSSPANETLYCEPGADLVEESYLPGDYSTASGLMHVRERRSTAVIVSGTVTFGSYDAVNDRTLMTLTIANTATDDLTTGQYQYDVLVTLGTVDEFWLAGEFIVTSRVTQPGVP